MAASLAAVSNPTPLRRLRRLAHGLGRLRRDSSGRPSRDRSTAPPTPRLAVGDVRSRLGTNRQSGRNRRDAPVADVPAIRRRVEARERVESIERGLAYLLT